jgi:hypothetical protein
MKNRLAIIIISLMATTLACNLPLIHPEPRTISPTILSMDVNPPSGKSDFTLAVSYSVFWVPDKRIVNIKCAYYGPGDISGQIGQLDMFKHIGAPTVETRTENLPFSIGKKNGKLQGGIYMASCGTENNYSTMTSTFEVVGDPTETPTPSSTPSPSPTMTPTLTTTPSITPTPAAVLRKGKIIFDFLLVESNRPGAGSQVFQVTNPCIPEVTFAPDGVISGTCEKANTAGHMVTSATFTATVSGNVDSSGKITFTYDISEIGNPNGAWRVNYSASGSFSSGNQASGTANFGYSCVSGSENLLWCGHSVYSPSETFSGTVPWKFEPAP